MSRILVTGAAGQVGRALLAAVGPARDVTGFTSAQWDITDPGAASGRLRDADVLVNCAAYTNVDAAATDPDTAFAVNAAGPGHLAGACVLAGARLIHISTDYVFGGGPRPPAPYEPTDATAPMQVYGAGKLAGETAVLGTLPTATVVRTAWVYTGHRGGTDFVSVMRARAEAGAKVQVVDDQIGSPTYVADLVDALLHIVDAGVTAPIVHAANAGAVSRWEQARAVYTECGADPDLVEPVPGADYPRPAPRPSYSVLGARESTAAGLPPLRDWRAGLAAALR